ncbi:MAG TPA: hypothetical protein VJX67_21555, partial [Blastocatellia bacterium]|nr:hypothetical protein [Blastocatellia bacterium]
LSDAATAFPKAISSAEMRFQTSKDGFDGFDANDDRDGIWFQGTAMMASAYKKLGQADKYSTFISQLRAAQASAPGTDGRGLVEASHDGVTTGFTDPATGQAILLYRRRHIGTTAWYALAELGVNPYHPGPARMPVIASLSIKGKNLLVRGQNFDTGAVILLNGVPRPTANDMRDPATLLIGKKVGKRIRPGDKVKVQNLDGSQSNEVVF